MSAFRWGIWGTGEVSRKFALGLRAVEGARPAWVLGRDRARSEALARRVGAETGFGAPGEAFAEGADALYIATPAALHAEHAAMALEAGIPALVEKPFAADADGAGRIVEAARAARVFCMEAMWTRFHPAVAEARRLIAEGAIGTPRLLRAEFCIATAPGGSLFDPALGGGALRQRGVYPLSVAAHLLGAPEAGQAMIRPAPSGVDAEIAATLRHPQGAIAQIRASLTTTAPNGLEVLGDAGALVFEGPVYRPHGLRLRSYSPRGAGGPGRLAAFRETGLAHALQRRLGGLRGPKWRRVSAPYAGNGYGHEAQEVMDRIRAGETESPVMPLDESAALAELMDRLLAEGARA
jgi:predicted dehydrogenase